MSKLFALLVTVLFFTLSSVASADVYVSTTGSDLNPGTLSQPFLTVHQGLLSVPDNQTVHVASGVYPGGFNDQKVHTNVTVLGQNGASIAGGGFGGASGVHLRNLEIRGPVVIRGGSNNLTLSHNDWVLDGTKECIQLNNGAHDITIRNNTMHRCKYGFVAGTGGGGTAPQSWNITVRDNKISEAFIDGFQGGRWDYFSIQRNWWNNIGPYCAPNVPDTDLHEDAIHLWGLNSHGLIQGNWVDCARSQGFQIQETLGPIDDVDLDGNVISSTSSPATQIWSSNSDITNNVFCNKVLDRADHGLKVHKYPGYRVTNNVASGYTNSAGATYAEFTNNTQPCTAEILAERGMDPRVHEAVGADFTWEPLNPKVGEPVTFFANPRGKKPFSFRWQWPRGYTNPYTATFNTAGRVWFRLDVTDSTGAVASVTKSFVVG